jgi:hypothetical protein
MGVAGNNPGVAGFLVDRSPYYFYSATIDESIIIRMIDQTNSCATQ